MWHSVVIITFNARTIMKSTNVEDTMVRLNTNLLQPVPEVFCEAISALLNVRSIVAKLPDVKADNSLRSASICETWLNASRPSPVLLDNQIDIRCDRISCENRGGVMIRVHNQMNPQRVCNQWN